MLSIFLITAFDSAQIGQLLKEESKKYCIEIFEQNPSEDFVDNPFDENDLNKSLLKWSYELLGSAGKTCFIVLPINQYTLKDNFYNEFQLIIHQYENIQNDQEELLRMFSPSDGFDHS